LKYETRFNACSCFLENLFHSGWADPLLSTLFGPTNPLAMVCLGMPGCLTGERQLEEMFGTQINDLTSLMHLAVAELQLDTGATDSQKSAEVAYPYHFKLGTR
jgi:hypothetical protein